MSSSNDTNSRVVQVKYNDQIVRMFTLATIFWVTIAMLVGIIVACNWRFHNLTLLPG